MNDDKVESISAKMRCWADESDCKERLSAFIAVDELGYDDYSIFEGGRRLFRRNFVIKESLRKEMGGDV